MRQTIVDAHAEYPGLSLHEIARICYVQFNRKPSITPISWCWQTDLRPRARRAGFPTLTRLQTRQSGAA